MIKKQTTATFLHPSTKEVLDIDALSIDEIDELNDLTLEHLTAINAKIEQAKLIRCETGIQPNNYIGLITVKKHMGRLHQRLLRQKKKIITETRLEQRRQDHVTVLMDVIHEYLPPEISTKIREEFAYRTMNVD